MTIVKATPDLSPVDIYKLTMNPSATKMKEVAGQRLEIAAFAVYEDVDKKSGELQNILAIKTPENEVFATNSPTFIDEFCKMVDFFSGYNMPVDSIKVITGTSKAGRDYISCTYGD